METSMQHWHKARELAVKMFQLVGRPAKHLHKYPNTMLDESFVVGEANSEPI